ncbi:hypothetical protein ASF27_17245 [Methylobacterium sp. Leaf102]|uniref:SEL1-like repeat protein n=1 Tax=Methylobacterium sp. Leaf102 TaxID=1736253 RepID=UPI0007017C3E|nr:SEL1-like repeat protein [Methylobacterium sp. Leaf102]KQP32750.1 hypothetical protein ASF27_17245 [Methylobacterium sp. Leaf102]
MTRSAPIDLDGFDPDILDAARDVARRAGVPVETWIASIVTPDDVAAPQRDASSGTTREAPATPPGASPAKAPRQGTAKSSRENPSKPAPKTAPPAPLPDAKPAPGAEAAEAGSEAPATATPTPDATAQALAEMMQRLDAIDRRIAQEQTATQTAASRTIADLQRRVAELGEQVVAPRPIGRRGRSAALEVRDAVSEIRQRQRELDTGPAPIATVIGELRSETSRLRASLDGVATGREVGALEEAMHALATGVDGAPAQADLSAVTAPLDRIRAEVGRLCGDTAREVQTRLAADLETLGARVDAVLSNGPDAFADREALDELFRELHDIRTAIAGLAAPERIETLASGVAAISAEIARLQTGVGADSGVASLRPLLEEIRSGLNRPVPGGLEDRIDAMAAKLDALRDGSALNGGPNSNAIIHRIDALSAKVDAVHVNPVGDLIERLEGLGATLRRPVLPDGDLAAIHGMLHDLSVKVDRMGTSDTVSAEGLDSLEHQVLALAARIDTRDSDPALAGLERTMGDLLAQVSALREEAPLIERTGRHGSVETQTDGNDLVRLQAGLADLRDQQFASEQRLQSTLVGVHSILERLAGRVGSTESGPMSSETQTPAERLLGTGGMPPTKSAARFAGKPIARASARTTERPIADAVLGDLPLEPGARRPGRDPITEDAEPNASAALDGDIKSSFIAAARRAAQVAQAEASGAVQAPRARHGSDASSSSEAVASAPVNARFARLRAELDRRRKPLLLGLAAIILALGALQAIGTRGPARETVAASAEAPRTETPAGAASGLPDPVTTQSLADSASLKEEVAKADATKTDSAKTDPARVDGAKAETVRSGTNRIVPQVTAMAALSPDLTAVPANLASLRQAAIEGDGTAVYDLAARFADGRGVTRDLALSHKLYDRLAQAGYAPAQYKLGGLHEKGLGVPRDLAQAKVWYGRAAEQGNARAMHNLAVIHAETPTASGKPDYTTAGQWFRRAAEYGLRDSQYNLAVLYARGLGVQQDLQQSFLWFSAAGAQGDADAAKKRDDVAAKLEPKDLATARALVAAFKAKVPDPATNEAPTASAAPRTMTLLGATPPAPVTPPRRS